MMFGQTAAVNGFLRFSCALATIAARLFYLIVVEFFADFTQSEASDLAESAQETLEELKEILGWKLAWATAKRKDFSRGSDDRKQEYRLSEVGVATTGSTSKDIARSSDDMTKRKTSRRSWRR